MSFDNDDAQRTLQRSQALGMLKSQQLTEVRLMADSVG
jgi:hypothetical protein